MPCQASLLMERADQVIRGSIAGDAVKTLRASSPRSWIAATDH